MVEGIWTPNLDPVASSIRVAAVFDYIYSNSELYKMGNKFAAHGNSGGSAQIAFSMCYYHLGDLLDVAVLGSGPPLAPNLYPLSKKKARWFNISSWS